MSMINKNKLGGGDGISQNVPSKERTPVASSRRFATRGVSNNLSLRKKLKEALETFQTPPQSPLRKRSLSIPEITTTRKYQINGSPIKHKFQEVRVQPKSRMVDAGRRVTHQLVLNAWRQRRRQVAALIESRDALTIQVEQLQIQIEVLQKLRETESQRRSEATSETKKLQVTIDELEKNGDRLEQRILACDKRESMLQTSLEKLNVDLMNERNTNKTLTNQKLICEQAFDLEKHQLQLVQEERNSLISRMEECEKKLEGEQNNCKSLESAIKMSENKYVEIVDKCEDLQKKLYKIEQCNVQLKQEKVDVAELLRESNLKNAKLDGKIYDLKKVIQANKQSRKKLVEEADVLRRNLSDLRIAVEKQRRKQWWKSTGEFLIESLGNVAQLLFPALPGKKPYNKADEFQIRSIGLGKL